MQTEEQNTVDLVLCMGKYSLLVATESFFHRNVCSELHCTKLTYSCMNWSRCLFLFRVKAGCSSCSPPRPHSLAPELEWWNISPQYLEDQWTVYLESFYVLHLLLMPFLQQHLRETPRCLHILSDVTDCTFQHENVQHRVGSLLTFNSACCLLFVTAHITEEQVAAITYYLKTNLVKFHLGNLGFSGRVFSSVGFFFSSCLYEIVSFEPFVPSLFKLPMLYLWASLVS